MEIFKSFKFRIYPSKEQKVEMAKQFGCCRFVYNHFLRKRIDHYAETGQGMSKFKMIMGLPELKQEYDWLKEANSQSLQASLADLDKAYVNFFKRNTGFPKFKKKNDAGSFQVPQHFVLDGNKLRIPKIGKLKIKRHREMEGSTASVTISKSPSGKYHASFLCRAESDIPDYNGNVVGLDLGLKDFAVLSDGEHDEYVKHPKIREELETKLAKEQRNLSRKQKGSQNRRKQRVKVAKVYEKITNKTKDFLHKLSRRLVSENQVIHIEDLNIKGMVKNHNLAKSISSSDWGEFVRQLEYKGSWYGCLIEKIDRFFPSSKRCNNCGWIKTNLKLSDREWTCKECNVTHDRDVNAARNILKFSTAGSAGIDAFGEDVRLSSDVCLKAASLN